MKQETKVQGRQLVSATSVRAGSCAKQEDAVQGTVVDLAEAVTSPQGAHKQAVEGVGQQGGPQVGQHKGAQVGLARQEHRKLKAMLSMHQRALQV